MAKVGIVMGSDSDMPVMAKAAEILDTLNGLYPLRSQTKSIADRNPYSLRAIIQSHDPHSRLFP